MQVAGSIQSLYTIIIHYVHYISCLVDSGQKLVHPDPWGDDPI